MNPELPSALKHASPTQQTHAINYTQHDASTAQNVTGKTNLMKQSHVTQESQMVQPKALGRQFTTVCTMSYMGLQCFDAVGWEAGRASGL